MYSVNANTLKSEIIINYNSKISKWQVKQIKILLYENIVPY